MWKILFIINQLSFGGAERQLFHLAQELDPQAFKASICVMTPSSEILPAFSRLRIPIIKLKKWLPRFDFTRVVRLSRVLRSVRPDLVHSFMGTANIYSWLATRLVPIPFVASERNAEAQMTNATLRLSDRAFLAASHVIVNSQAGADWLIGRRPDLQKKTSVIRNGINLSRFNNLCTRPSRHSLGLRPDVPTIGIIGSLSQRKDHETFFHAMRTVRQEWGDAFQILCVGEGRLLAQMKTLAAELGLGRLTVFAGRRSDVPGILTALDLLVLSSRWEGMPNVIMEAMAARKAVVATRVGGTPELVADGETGLLVPVGQPKKLAKATLRLLKDPSMRTRMGELGRRRIESGFTIDEMVRSTESVYQRLLGG